MAGTSKGTGGGKTAAPTSKGAAPAGKGAAPAAKGAPAGGGKGGAPRKG